MWSFQEKRTLSIYFEKYIKAAKAPGKDVCNKFLNGKEHLFPNRSWTNIKDCVRNLGMKKQKSKK
jgi:hypothetical protein